MTPEPNPLREVREVLHPARDVQRLPQAVMRFHARVDAILDQSRAAHAVEAACKRGCSLCCHVQVEMLPPEAFALAAWLKRRRTPEELARIGLRLKANAERTRALGVEGRKRANLACALLGDEGDCTAYEARPAQCRRFHSTDLAACKASFARPDDDSVLSPAHPLVAHNAQVVVTVAQQGLRERGLDATPQDMNFALLHAIEDPRSWRRWRDGKKAFVASALKALALVPLLLGVMLEAGMDLE